MPERAEPNDQGDDAVADETPTLTFEEMGDLGLVQEINRQLLHPIGLALARHEDGTLTVLSDPDPEGWRFGGFDLAEKAGAFAARQAEWHQRRLDALGYVVQPLDDPKCPGCSTDGSNAMGLQGHFPNCVYNPMRSDA